ncbi:MAG: ABC transporter ATP-binding protein [Planctomycetota bacterium]|nr:ABC transporter ATP-binding protein [Planctomycetota bacterium]
MTQQSPWPVVRRLVPYFRRVRGPFLLSLLFLFLISSLTGLKAWIIQPVVDTFQGGDIEPNQLYLFVGIVVGIFVLQAVFNFCYLVTFRRASIGIAREIRSEQISKLLEHGLGYFHARPTGEITSRVVNDVQAFKASGVVTLQMILRDLITILVLLSVMIAQSLSVAVVCCGIIFAVGLILKIMSRRIRKLARDAQDKLAQVTNQLTQVIGGIELILSFGLGSTWRDRLQDVNVDHSETEMKVGMADAIAISSVLITVSLGVGAILLVTGRSLLAGEITSGEFAAIFGAIYLMQAPAQKIASSVSNISKGIVAGGRALELLDEDPVIRDPEHPRAFVEAAGRVELRDVSFGYRDTPVIRSLSFAVEPGELVVMVGDSGAGKSTVAKMLLRFYDPDAGAVVVDGVALPELMREDLYRSISYVGQDVYLFDETVDFNLRVGRPQASADEVAAAMRIACVDEFAAQLPQGLETSVGERGVLLSGGQRQRIAIARAILSEARILVLDEATSALDMDLERKILQNLVDAPKRRTIFAITHRLSMAGIADRVIVLKDGRLVEEGTAAELADSGGEFTRLQRASQTRLVRTAQKQGRVASPLPSETGSGQQE